MNTARRTSARVVAMRLTAAIGLCVILTGSAGSAQDTEVQALKLEIEALRLKQEALQKEVDALKLRVAQTPTPVRPPVPPAVPLGNIVLKLDKAPTRGDASAKITLVEVSDFECPFCGRHFKNTSELIEKNYVETGKIRLAFLHYPLASHRNAFKAAEAGACAADQGKFWEMHDRLFSNQAQLVAPMLPTHAEAVGLNANLFRTCLDTSQHAQDIRNDFTMAQQAGVTGTPAFFIGTVDPKTRTMKVVERIIGAKAYPAFQQALDAALAQQ